MPKTAEKPKTETETETNEVAIATGSYAQGDFQASDIIMPELRLAQGGRSMG